MLRFSTTWYLGTLTCGAFLILVGTGIPLMFYYHPSASQAYTDTRDLQYVVFSGMFMRNLHRWSAHAMVFLAFAHMFKVFYRGAYRPPHEFNWVIGVILLLITLLLSYTGYLLPWDQLAYWAITIGSSIVSAVPVLGNRVRFLMLGGNAVNDSALLRFYVLHCMILPVAAILLIAVHLWRIRKDGGLYHQQSEPKASAVVGMDTMAHKHRRASAQVGEEHVYTVPDVLFRLMVAIEALAIALVGMALLFNAPLEGIADPSHTPNPAKAPWYFLGLQELLHYFPPMIAGVLVPAIVILALIAMPYFTINIQAEGLFLRNRKRRLLVFYLLAAGLTLFLCFYDAYIALFPTLIVAGLIALAAKCSPHQASTFQRGLGAKPLSFWIMTWFLLELVALTAVGTFFRGPGWSWVLPWRS